MKADLKVFWLKVDEFWDSPGWNGKTNTEAYTNKEYAQIILYIPKGNYYHIMEEYKLTS